MYLPGILECFSGLDDGEYLSGKAEKHLVEGFTAGVFFSALLCLSGLGEGNLAGLLETVFEWLSLSFTLSGLGVGDCLESGDESYFLRTVLFGDVLSGLE